MENSNLDIDREREAYEYANAMPSVVDKTTQSIQELQLAVENGIVSGLDVFAVFKKLEKIFDEAKKKVETYAFDEAEKHGAKTFTNNGCEFSIRQGYAQYNFDEDHIYSDLKQRLKEYLKGCFSKVIWTDGSITKWIEPTETKIQEQESDLPFN